MFGRKKRTKEERQNKTEEMHAAWEYTQKAPSPPPFPASPLVFFSLSL